MDRIHSQPPFDTTLRPGDRVCKPSGKPFKSGAKINTIRDMQVNPHTGRPAFSFVEDDSVVDAHQCERTRPTP